MHGKHAYIPDIDLHLDAGRQQPYGFISHAHTDHTARHKKILSSEATAAFLQTRLKNPVVQTLAFGKYLETGGTRISLHPAGHILGSAQILIENSKGRLLYTGDFRTLPANTVEPFRQVTCDTLIMETTFGQPKYRFPDRKDVLENLDRIIIQKLNEGITPVVLVYPLGKGQEILYHLSRRSYPVAVDYPIIRLAWIYEKFGISFGAYERFRRSEYRSKVLLLPASYRFQNYLKGMEDKYLIYMSGWGMDPSAKFRLGVDEVLPFSDHADFNQLIEFVHQVQPEKVFITHGYDSFVYYLRKEGFKAGLLEETPQLSLF